MKASGGEGTAERKRSHRRSEREPEPGEKSREGRVASECKMLDPSSSEEESDGIVEEEYKETKAPQAGSRISPSRTSESSGGLAPSSSSRSSARPTSPSPSAASEEKDDLEKLQRDEEDRKKKLQLYVFVMRCIAYPFNAKQPTDMARRQQKVRHTAVPGPHAGEMLPMLSLMTYIRRRAERSAAQSSGCRAYRTG